VIRLDKSGGCVDRSEAYMKALRHAQIREYFFGHGEDALAPSSMTSDFGELNVLRIVEGDGTANNLKAGDADDYASADALYEPQPVSSLMQNALLAITTAHPNDKHEVIRDSSVRGYIYVADVDEAKRKVRLLSPQPGHLPAAAMVVGSWPEDVAGLVS
jgi:polyribonucleotide 5'-hydroxyl-kinase